MPLGVEADLETSNRDNSTKGLSVSGGDRPRDSLQTVKSGERSPDNLRQLGLGVDRPYPQTRDTHPDQSGSQQEMTMFKSVLFPVDGSRESREAAVVVADIVKTYQAKLTILSVVEPPEEGQPPSASNSPEAIANLLKSAQEVFAQQGIEAEAIERQGKAAFTICDVADELEMDLIVMGSRGTGLTDEGAAESVTNLTINLSPCAVLVVP